MRIDHFIHCVSYPCTDVRHDAFAVPGVTITAAEISVVLISECAPRDPADSYYAKGKPLFLETTVQAFNDAGLAVKTWKDLLQKGIYLTTAVKCAKASQAIQTATVQRCSLLLEQELALFPNVKAYLLMGDVAIRAINTIARRSGEGRIIPAGSTYKIRGDTYTWRGARVYPSYLQAGPSFYIEKSKRRMIVEDIRAACSV